MLTYILIGAGVLLVLFLLFVASRPADFRVTRSGTVGGSPSDVFGMVNNFRAWNEWSPWAKLDPSARNTFEGPEAGPGAVFRWDGNKHVGSGAMTILDSREGEFVRIRLEFTRPFRATNATEFTFRPDSAGTVVSWTMSGRNGFMGKLMSVVMNCDRMVGGQFEQGLKNLDAALRTRVPA